MSLSGRGGKLIVENVLWLFVQRATGGLMIFFFGTKWLACRTVYIEEEQQTAQCLYKNTQKEIRLLFNGYHPQRLNCSPVMLGYVLLDKGT